MIFLKKMIDILIHPNNFFESIKSRDGIYNAFIYYFIISIFSFVIFRLKDLLIVLRFPYYLALGVPVSPITPFFESILWFCISLISSFFIAGLFHLFMRLIGKKNEFSTSYKITVYSLTPLLVFYPFFNLILPLDIVTLVTYIIFHLYFAFLFILGFYKLYELNKVKLILFVIFLTIVYSIYAFTIVALLMR